MARKTQRVFPFWAKKFSGDPASPVSLLWMYYNRKTEARPVSTNPPKTARPAFKQIVAGYGEIYASSEQAKRAILYTVQHLESILEAVRGTLDDGAPRPGSEILQAATAARGIALSTLPQYVLCQTTVQAALSELYTRHEAYPLIQENNLAWQRNRIRDTPEVKNSISGTSRPVVVTLAGRGAF